MNSQSLVTDIDQLIKDIFRHLDNPEELSKDILKVSVKNVGLGNFLIEALDNERAADTLYKWTVDGRKLELMSDRQNGDETIKGFSATQAESTAKVEAREIMDNLNKAHKAVDLLKIKRSDTEKVIDAARSRLSLIKQDMRQA